MSNQRHRKDAAAADSPYPKTFRHVVHGVLFLTSLASSGLLGYSVYYAAKNGTPIPIELIIFAVASIITLILTTLSIIVHMCHPESPRLSLWRDCYLLLKWTLLLGIFGYRLYRNIPTYCNSSTRGLCKTSIALLTIFALIWLTVLLSLLMDVRAIRRSRRNNNRGEYAEMRTGSVGHKSPGVYVEVVNAYQPPLHQQQGHHHR